jgi:hypothetical protein
VKKGLPEEVSTIELIYLAIRPNAEIITPPKNIKTTVFETHPWTGT